MLSLIMAELFYSSSDDIAVNSYVSAIGRRYDDLAQSQEG